MSRVAELRIRLHERVPFCGAGGGHDCVHGPHGLHLHARLALGTLDLGSGGELKLDLKGLTVTATKDGEYVPGDAAGDHLGLMHIPVTSHRLQCPRQHALPHQWRVRFRVIEGVDGVVAILSGEFGAAFGDCLQAHAQVDNAD